MFIQEQDYKVVIGDTALKTITGTTPEARQNAEEEAIEEISSYLRPRYNTQAIFSAEGDQRNKLLVMYAVDIALYHLIAALPQKMGSEVRRERYERAIKWLEGVQAGKIIPDLPEATGEEGEELPSTAFLLTSQPPLKHNW